MSKYYDLDKLKELIEAKAETLIGDGAIAFHAVGKWLDFLPAADGAPVVHAHWIMDKHEYNSWYSEDVGTRFICSNCERDVFTGGTTIDMSDEEFLKSAIRCPFCEAIMDEEATP